MKKIGIFSFVILMALVSPSFSFGQENGDEQGGGEKIVEASFAAQKLAEASSIIRFSVTSDGTSGKKWIIRLKKAGFFIHDENLLSSKNFKPTKGITYNIVIYKGKLWSKNDRTSINIKNRAAYASLTCPSLEIACLIREQIPDEELAIMGLSSIIFMRDMTKTSKDMLSFIIRYDGFGSWLDTIHFSPSDLWGESCGFAFVE